MFCVQVFGTSKRNGHVIGQFKGLRVSLLNFFIFSSCFFIRPPKPTPISNVCPRFRRSKSALTVLIRLIFRHDKSFNYMLNCEIPSPQNMQRNFAITVAQYLFRVRLKVHCNSIWSQNFENLLYLYKQLPSVCI